MKRVTSDNYFELDHNIRDLSEAIAYKTAVKNGNFSLDPLTILSIANVVISVIRLLYVCYSNRSKDILDDVRDPNWFQRIMIKKQIKKHIDDDMVDDVYKSLVEQSKVMSTKDIDNVLYVCKNKQMFKESK